MKPPIPITDKRFKYINAASTDLRKTFERIKREQHRAKIEAQGVAEAEVINLRRKV